MLYNQHIKCVPNKGYVLCLALFWVVVSFSQKRSPSLDLVHVERSMEIMGYNGIANYNYKLKQGDTLLNGIFQLKKDINVSNFDEKEKRFFSFIGAFSDNIPDKNWQFTFGEFKPNRKSNVVDYKYVIELNGVRDVIKGRLDKGTPQGIWTVRRDSIKDSEVSSTLFSSEVEFRNGIPQKSFRIKTSQVSLVGRFLRNGYAHDQWSLFVNDGIDDAEHWYFEEGKLREVEIINKGQKTNLTVFKNNEENLITVDLDKSYIDILKLSNHSYQNQFFTDGVAALLLNNDMYYSRVEDILSAIGEPVKISVFRVKVPYYPLSSQEKEELDGISDKINIARKISNTILGNTQLNILKLSNPEMANLYNSTEQINQNYIKPLEILLYYHQQDLLHHKQRNQLVTYLFPKGIPSLSISPDNFKELASQLESSNGYLSIQGTDLVILSQLITSVGNLLEAFDGTLEEKISKEKRQKKILQEEEKLIEKAKKLSKSIDSFKTIVPSQSKNTLTSLNNYIKEELSNYSSIEQNIEKLKEAKRLNNCFTNIENLVEQISELPEQRNSIKEMYTEPMWNPFTSTTMDEIVKKRIYDAYDKILIPFILSEIQTKPNCDKFSDQHQFFKDLFLKMKTLRKEDTYKLERKLRRVKNPKTLLDLLGITYKIKVNK